MFPRLACVLCRDISREGGHDPLYAACPLPAAKMGGVRLTRGWSGDVDGRRLVEAGMKGAGKLVRGSVDICRAATRACMPVRMYVLYEVLAAKHACRRFMHA